MFVSNEAEEFKQEIRDNIAGLGSDRDLQELSNVWIQQTSRHRYTFNFSWMGRPIIQFPQDVFAMQELIWAVQPTLIIEAGIAHGGSLIFSASMLELNAASGGPSDAFVLGIDIDIRDQNRKAIEAHPMFKRISMIEGSSIAPDVIEKVRASASGMERVMVMLDSNHTHEHVLAELRAYAPLTTVGSYCVVFDTNIEDMPEEFYTKRPWGNGNNPKTAVWEFLKETDDFEIVPEIPDKLLVTVAPDGYLRRIK